MRLRTGRADGQPELLETRPTVRKWAAVTSGDNWLVRAVARVPAHVRTKLLVAFLGIVALLVVVGVLGLRFLGQANARVGAARVASGTIGDLSTRSRRRRPSSDNCWDSAPEANQGRRSSPARRPRSEDVVGFSSMGRSAFALATRPGDERGDVPLRAAGRRRASARADPSRSPHDRSCSGDDHGARPLGRHRRSGPPATRGRNQRRPGPVRSH